MKKVFITGALVAGMAITACIGFKANASTSLKQIQFNYNGDNENSPLATGIAYYSDDYFNTSAYDYNSNLSTASLAVTMASMNATEIDNYYYKSNHIVDIYNKFGFEDVEVNNDYRLKPTRDSIGVCAANKKIGNETLIALGIRSGAYGAEWASNFKVGYGYDINYHHQGFYEASSKALSFLNQYINDNDINGNIKLWVTGFSRGGATANLLAGRIDTALANNSSILDSDVSLDADDLYAYTFEAPMGASYNSININPRADLYDNIHNIINPNDIVPKVPFGELGFTRYGDDLFIDTKFNNPTSYSVSYSRFINQYNQLQSTNPYIIDSYNAKTMTGGDDDNKKQYNQMEVNNNLIAELTNVIGSRNNYVSSYQAAITDAMNLFFSEEPGETLTQFFKSMFSGWLQDLGIMKEDSSVIKMNNAVINTAIKKLLPLAYDLWTTYHSSELYSTIHNISSVGQAHSTNVCFAWLRSMDNNYNKYTLNRLNDNFQYYHIHLYAFNDLLLKSKSGAKLVEFEGHYFTKSDVTLYNTNGFSAGYYPSATNCNIELFIPVGNYTLTYDGVVKTTHKDANYSLYSYDGEVGCDVLITSKTNKLTIFSSAITVSI